MEIARSELYRLVCEKPLSKVAPGFGISGTVLSALCKKHNVPYPGSGHWTRISLGMPVSVQPLPPGEHETIEIPAAKPKRAVAKARAEAIKRSDGEKAGTEQSATKEQPIVKQRLLKPHPIIADWLEKHERRRRDRRDPYDRAPPPWTELDRRRHRLLDATFKALEARGGSVSDNGNGNQCVAIDGEKIEYQIREKMKQSKVAVPDSEKFYYSRGFRTDLVGTGYLVFAIKTYLRGPHNEEYLENDRQPLEERLPRIIDRLFEGAVILKAWHLEQEQEREKWRQEAARRAQLQRLAKEEEERWSRFAAAAGAWRTNQAVMQFIAELGATPHNEDDIVGDKTIREWLDWAKRKAAEQNPLGNGMSELFRGIDERTRS
ncbi:hypothetical protein EN813_047475 [Mesorhizobium sp. M00.F.Ca.ET.170.01.1.1]|nr:hypothetical protein EN813_047475 [Mesorhizobium sp. M00.F.Ca.ET.170.01.1.1]